MQTFQPIDWVPLVNIASGNGALFMHTIQVASVSSGTCWAFALVELMLWLELTLRGT